jgi:hypothetical protein
VALPISFDIGTPGHWELLVEPAIGTAVNPGSNRRFSGSARLDVGLSWMMCSEGRLRPGLFLTAHTDLSGRDVPFDAGRGDYGASLRLTKSLGDLNLQGRAGIRTRQRLLGWRHATERLHVRGSLSAAYRRVERYEALIDVSGLKVLTTPPHDRRCSTLTVTFGGGVFLHPQVLARLLLRHRGEHRMELQPGVTVSL